MKHLDATALTPGFVLVTCLLSTAAVAQQASEGDYFDPLPVVLSVSRLAQSPSDTPGAVTVIDADMIRRSGSRELAEVLKLVPGFLLYRRRGSDITADYHSNLDDFGARMQVYVDGRSVYSSFLLGDTHRGIAAVQLADVERIEVLRGSNSAAYGSNAFLGVINVITKAPADSHGVSVSLAGGEGGISDNHASIGWGSDHMHWRVSASRRSSSGLDNIYDDSRHSQLQVRGSVRASPDDEVSIDLGVQQNAYGDGNAPRTCVTLVAANGTCDTNPERTSFWRDTHARLIWNRQLDATSALRLAAGFNQEVLRADFIARQRTNPPLVVNIVAPLPTNGRADRQELEMQRTDIWQDWRTVVGVDLVREEARSAFFFSSTEAFSSHQVKLFAGAEWKPSSYLTANLAALWEKHDAMGEDFAPRLALNFHITPQHTLRLGGTRSFRYPSIYMYRAQAQYLVTVTPALIAPTTVPYARTTGKVTPETLFTTEVGYLGEFRDQQLRVDVRGFRERMQDRIGLTANGLDFNNGPGPTLRGFEYQLTWSPLPATRVLFSEAHIRQVPRVIFASGAGEAPHRTGSLSVFHDFDNGISLGLSDHYSTPSTATVGRKARQMDLRLAYAFRMGTTRAEAAVVTQAIGGSQTANLTANTFDRRAFATLKLDF